MTKSPRRPPGPRSVGAGSLILGLTVFHVVAPSTAWAYLDPVTGSIVLQVLAAGFLAAAATFRKSRDWFREMLKHLAKGRDS